MIITADDPNAIDIKVYDRDGKQLPGVLWVDTDTMTGEKVLLPGESAHGYSLNFTTGIYTKIIDIYEINGPNIFYKRKTSKRIINSGVIK
ncbi:MAG: hypothetical protein WC516_04465 [Patescibacteria group bacterium]|jgi:hypothetical protein